jgi:hypothetical protein
MQELLLPLRLVLLLRTLYPLLLPHCVRRGAVLLWLHAPV